MYKTIGLLAALFVLPSCALVRGTENEPLDPEIVRSFEPGKTTARTVTEKLGAPSQIVELGDRSAYRYDHFVTKGAGLLLLPVILAGSDSRSDRVWLFFDSNDVLSHVGATYSSHRAQYALPWDDVHEESDNASADADRPGLQPNR